MYLYLDESGDLGHKNLYLPGRSPFFILAGICTNDPAKIARCVARVRNTLMGKDIGEMKFTDSKPATRRRLLEQLAAADFGGFAVIVDKRTVFPTLMDKKEIYFNWVSGYLVHHLMQAFPAESVLNLIIDKRSFGKTREEFNKYIQYKVNTTLQRPLELRIVHENSQKELCLQATDFIAGAIHQRYRHGDHTLFNIVKDKLNMIELHRKIS